MFTLGLRTTSTNCSHGISDVPGMALFLSEFKSILSYFSKFTMGLWGALPHSLGENLVDTGVHHCLSHLLPLPRVDPTILVLRRTFPVLCTGIPNTQASRTVKFTLQ
jgi:hypothetical protein